MGMIIAMKGHPGTGKSTLANAIASALKIPLLDKDDVRDSTMFLQNSLTTNDSSSSSSSDLNDLSYRAIWAVAATQLRVGLSLVVDSPLSRRAHLDHLLSLRPTAGVVIVECRPGDLSEWRRRLEQRRSDHHYSTATWHKPATWHDLERLIEGYGGCTEFDVGEVPRLVVDTTDERVSAQELLSTVLEFIRSCGGPAVAPIAQEAMPVLRTHREIKI